MRFKIHLTIFVILLLSECLFLHSGIIPSPSPRRIRSDNAGTPQGASAEYNLPFAKEIWIQEDVGGLSPIKPSSKKGVFKIPACENWFIVSDDIKSGWSWARIGPYLEKLSQPPILVFFSINEKKAEELAPYLPFVKGVQLDTLSRITKKGLQLLCSNKNLYYFCIWGHGRRNGEVLDLMCLGKITGLQELGIDNMPKVSDKELEFLKSLPKLRELSLQYLDISGECLSYIKNPQILEELDLSGAGVSDSYLCSLENMKNLKGLSLYRTKISDAGMAHLQELGHLEYLDLEKTHITNAGLSYIKNMKSLKRLSLFETDISDAGMAYLQGLDQLEYLSLYKTHITNAGLSYISNLRHLKTLFLPSGIGDAGLAELKNLKNLEVLNLTGVTLTDKSFEYIAAFNKLKKLNLSNATITAADLSGLEKLDTLEYINFHGVDVSYKWLKSLSKLKSLKEITLSFVPLSKDEVERLPKVLKNIKVGTSFARPDEERAERKAMEKEERNERIRAYLLCILIGLGLLGVAAALFRIMLGKKNAAAKKSAGSEED